MRPVLGLHARTPAPNKRGQRGSATRPKDGQPGEGERPKPDAPHSGERSSPRGNVPPPPRGRRHPIERAHQRVSAGSPHPHTRARSKWKAGPDCLPQARAAGEGWAPNHRRPLQRREAPPWGCPPATLSARNAGSQERALLGTVLGPQVHTTRVQKERAAGIVHPPRGRAAGRGRAPDTRRHSQR